MIFRSPLEDVVIPDLTLTELVLADAPSRGDRAALVDGPSGRTITYAELPQMVDRVAAGLAGRGFGKGDVLALHLPNMPEFAVAFHAAVRLGGVVTPVPPLYRAEEVGEQLRDSNARFVITLPELVPVAAAASAGSMVEEVFAIGAAEGATAYSTLLAESGGPPGVDIDPARDLAALPYSSGTTGLPKGVCLTHRNLMANIVQVRDVHFAGADDVMIAVLPFFHIYGLTVLVNFALHRGVTVVTMPRFDLEQFLGLLQDHRVTRAFLVPPILMALARHPAVDRYDLSALRIVVSGAAPIDPSVLAAVERRLGCVTLQGYGLTETSPVTHIHIEGPEMASHPASVGQCMPSTECRIVDPEGGAELEAGQDGEIAIRGPQVMAGYLGRPEATAAVLDARGWFHTGDVGHCDADGFLYITDRLKELIKVRGLQVAPAELEKLLVSYPGVADAAVIGVPHSHAGQVPKAFVVTDGELDTAALARWVTERVADHKRLRGGIEVVDSIPRSAAGKVLRRVLAEPG